MANINPILEIRQNDTIEEVLVQLNSFGKSIFIRPTGFGKTYLLVNKLAKPYIEANPDKKVLYIYPLDIIKTGITAPKKVTDSNGKVHYEPNKYMEDGILNTKNNGNIEFISYHKLSKILGDSPDEILNIFDITKVSLVILDEAHRAGADRFYDIYNMIKDRIRPDGIHLVGATATPNRMDEGKEYNGVEKEAVLDYIFDGHQPFSYDLGNAIQDGLIHELVYKVNKYVIMDTAKKLRELHRIKENSFKDESFNTEISKLYEATGSEPSTIVESLLDAGYDLIKTKYYKFIIFLPSILGRERVKDSGDRLNNGIVDRAEEVEEWFTEAFNSHMQTQYGLRKPFEIHMSYLASDDKAGELRNLVAQKPDTRSFYRDTKKIEQLEETPYRVDVIMTVDMINMGYHVENITGVMMLRGTKSEATYYQQIGRAISVTAEHKPIVLDFVNNIGEYFWFAKDAKHKDSAGLNDNTYDTDRDNTGMKGKIEIQFCGTMNADTNAILRLKQAGAVDRIMFDILYNQRQMPLYLIAAYLKAPIRDIAKRIAKLGIPIRDETAQYNILLEKATYYKNNKDTNNFKYYAGLLPLVNCRDAVYGKCPYITNKQTPTVYEAINK